MARGYTPAPDAFGAQGRYRLKSSLVIRLCRTAAVFSLWLATSPAASAQPEIPIPQATDFFAWQIPFAGAPSSPLIVGTVETESGDSFYRLRQTPAPGFFGSTARLGNPLAQWSFVSQGSIDRLMVSLRLRVDVPDTVPGEAPTRPVIRVQPVLVQGGRVYRSARAFVWTEALFDEHQWIAMPRLAIVREDFQREDNASLRPDFGPTAPTATLGFEVGVQLPASTGGTYVTDLDDVVVNAVRSSDGPPGVAIDPEGLAIDPTTGIGYRAVSSLPPGEVILRVVRAGDPQVPLTVRGRSWTVREGIDGPARPFSVQLAAGQPSAVLTFHATSIPNDNPSCPLRIEVELQSATGGQLLLPSRVSVLVRRTEDGVADCFVAYALILQQTVPCSAQRTSSGLSAGGFSKIDQPLDDLTTLRAFRDRVMAAESSGRYYRELYATHSPAAIGALFRRPQLLLDLNQAWDPWVAGAAAMLAGRGDTVTVTPRMLNDLRKVLDGLKAVGAPSLRRAIEQEVESPRHHRLDRAELQRALAASGEPRWASDLCRRRQRPLLERREIPCRGRLAEAQR